MVHIAFVSYMRWCLKTCFVMYGHDPVHWQAKSIRRMHKMNARCHVRLGMQVCGFWRVKVPLFNTTSDLPFIGIYFIDDTPFEELCDLKLNVPIAQS
jgi:hypothetical protein